MLTISDNRDSCYDTHILLLHFPYSREGDTIRDRFTFSKCHRGAPPQLMLKTKVQSFYESLYPPGTKNIPCFPAEDLDYESRIRNGKERRNPDIQNGRFAVFYVLISCKHPVSRLTCQLLSGFSVNCKPGSRWLHISPCSFR